MIADAENSRILKCLRELMNQPAVLTHVYIKQYDMRLENSSLPESIPRPLIPRDEAEPFCPLDNRGQALQHHPVVFDQNDLIIHRQHLPVS